MTRKLFTLSLFAAGLLALILYLAQSDSVRADTPTAVSPQAEAATEDTDATITLTATHVDGLASPSCLELTFALTSSPTDGTLSAITDVACVAGTLAADADTDTATVVYTPNAEFNGTDSFTYTAAHGGAPTGPVTVDITVAAVDDAPVAADQTVTTPINTDVVVTLNATDIDTCDLTFTATSPLPAGSSLSAVTDVACTENLPTTDTTPNSDSATVTYTPDTDNLADGSFTFSAGATATTVTVVINTQPVAQSQTLTTPVNTALPITLTGTDADPTVVADCELTFAIPTGEPFFGSLTPSPLTIQTCTIDSSGTDTVTGTYVPPVGFVGTDVFTFTVDDGITAANATSDAATVTITVGAAPDGEPGDCNGDGVTNIVDVLRLLRFVAGQAVTLSC